MNKIFASILITNFNKSRYLDEALKSCINQKFKNKEILIFDDCSTDNSLKIIKKYKRKIKLKKNKKKKFTSGPLNQIAGIIDLFKKSKGEIIFFLDGDDSFKKNKVENIVKFFEKNKEMDFIQDRPYMMKFKKEMYIRKKYHYFSIWPGFYPTSSIAIRRKFFLEFLKYIEKNKFSNLEVDARISMFAFLKKQFSILDKSFTNYNLDETGITSKYKKYSTLWWKKRDEAFTYLFFLHKKLKIRFSYSIDFFITKLINFFI